MNIKPLGAHVLVKPLKKVEMTKSGIVLPDTADKKEKMEGEVVAIGTGKVLDNGTMAPMPVAVGQKILFKKWGGDEVEFEGEEYKIISQDDILAILE